MTDSILQYLKGSFNNWPSQKHSLVDSQHGTKTLPPLPLPQPQIEGKRIPGKKTSSIST